MKAPKAKGHQFGEDLVCECGVSIEAHRQFPKPCELRSKPTPKKRFGSTSSTEIANLRRLLGYPLRHVAQAVELSVQTVSRVENDQLSGAGRSSDKARETVARYLRDQADG